MYSIFSNYFNLTKVAYFIFPIQGTDQLYNGKKQLNQGREGETQTNERTCLKINGHTWSSLGDC